MNFRRIWVISRKEWTDAFRDRRSFYSLAIGALIGPLLVGFMMNRIAEQRRTADEIKIPIMGRQNAPALVSWLDQQAGIDIIDAPTNPQEAVRSGKTDFVVVIPKNFGEKFNESRPAAIQLVSDSSKQSLQAKVSRVRRLLGAYSAEIGTLRLIARGVSPSVATALTVEDVEISSAQQRAAIIFNMIPLFVVLAAFTTAMQIATDSTAGERERGSLEPLLINPVPKSELVIGKWFAAAMVATGGMLVTLSLITAVLSRVPFQELGVRFTFGAKEASMLLAAALPMALMAPAVQIYLASFAKTFKEAQSYMGFLIMVPTLAGTVSLLYPAGDMPWLRVLPIAGQYLLATDVMGGKAPGPIWFIAAAAMAVALAALFISLTTRLFRSEKIVIGR